MGEKDLGFYNRGVEFEFLDSTEKSGNFVASESVVGTLRAHLSAGEIDRAATLYQSCSQDLGEELLKNLSVEGKPMVEALAKMFTESRDYKHAARCQERLGNLELAARLAEQAGAHEYAARLFQTIGNPEAAARAYLCLGKPLDAARLYQQAGNPGLAAEAFEQAGELIAAADSYAAAGAPSRALPPLQRVSPENPRFGEARLLLGSLCARLGQFDAAAKCFVATLRAGPPMHADVTVEMFYRLGHVYLKLDDSLRARAAFDRVEQTRPGYRDAAPLLAKLLAAAAAPPVPAPAPEPPPDAPGAVIGTLPAPAPPEEIAPPAPDDFDTVEVDLDTAVVGTLDGFEHLKGLSLTRDFSLDDLRLLYGHLEPIEFDAGRIVVPEGLPGAALFIVRQGELDVIVGGKQVARLGPGTCVGEMSLVDEGPTSAEVRAATPVEAFRLEKERFHHLLETRPALALSFYRALVETLVGRLRKQNESLRKS